MDISEKLKDLRTFKNLSTYELAEKTGIPQSTISKLENGNRKIDTDILQTIADAMEVPIDIFFQKQSPSEILGRSISDWSKFDKEYPLAKAQLEEFEIDSETSNKPKRHKRKSLSEKCETGEFKTAESAMKFILRQPAIMGFGGFDTRKMSDEEIIEFANELLNQLKLLSYKYKK